MELVERYLQAVGTYLPEKLSADILRELRENIMSQMEEREALLGRPLTDEEEAAIIRTHGHPIGVAARYGQKRHLIGPTLFPFYWLTLKASLLIAFVVRLVIFLMTLLVSNGGLANAGRLLGGFPQVLLAVFAGITIAFAALEYAMTRYPLAAKINWQPGKLPGIRRGRRTIARAHSAAGLIFSVAGAVWWQLVPAAPFLLLGPGAFFIDPGPVLAGLRFPVLCFITVRALLFAFTLLQPHVSPIFEWMEAGFSVIKIAFVIIIIQAGSWVLPSHALPDQAKAEHIAHSVNVSLRYIFAVLLIEMICGLAVNCYRLYRVSRPDVAGITANTFA